MRRGLTATLSILAMGMLSVSPVRAETSGVSVDASFVPPALNSVVTVTMPLSDGKLLVGGYFTNVDGVGAQDYLIRLNSDGSLDQTFTPPVLNSNVTAIAAVSGGKFLLGGNFTNADSNADADYLIRIAADGSLDTTFIPAGTKPQLNSAAVALLPLSDGSVVVGGEFTSAYGDSAYARLVRINTDGSRFASWSSTTNTAGVFGIAELSNGNLLVGGNFGGNNTLRQITALGALVSFVSVGGGVAGLTPMPDGSVIAVGGDMTNVGGNTAIDHVARFQVDGSVDTTFIPPVFSSSPAIRSAAATPDGQVLVGGLFSTVDGDSAYSNLARLNGDGTLDSSFVPVALGGLGVITAATRASGEIVVGGYFTNAGGVAGLDYLAQLLAPPLESSASDAPRAPMQQYGREEAEGCSRVLPDETDFPALTSMKPDAWGASWAWWPNGGTGGFVCTRQPYYTAGGNWAVR